MRQRYTKFYVLWKRIHAVCALSVTKGMVINMKKFVLPTVYPPITTYPQIACLFTILFVHEQEIMPWICDHYIQIIAIRDTTRPYLTWNFYDNGTFNHVLPVQNMPHFTFYREDGLLESVFFDKFTDYIEEAINNGYYIRTALDQYYLKCSTFNGHFLHDGLIYGYDRANKKIYIADFYGNRRYQFVEVPYDEINLAFRNRDINKDSPGWHYEIKLYKFRKYDYKTNFELLLTSVRDYIECKESLIKYKFSYENEAIVDKLVYGLEYYNLLLEYGNDKIFDVRAFHLLYDHKVLWNLRLEYLMQQSLINEKIYNKFRPLFQKIEQDSLIVRNSLIKYNICSTNQNLHKVLSGCEKLREQDRKVMSEFYSAIQ